MSRLHRLGSRREQGVPPPGSGGTAYRPLRRQKGVHVQSNDGKQSAQGAEEN